LKVPGNSIPTVEELVAAGRYAEAARRAAAAGDQTRAAQLFEKIWDFASAARSARAGGDLPRALRNAVDARDEPLVREIETALRDLGPDGVRAALDVFAGRRRFGEAAELAEELGDRARAADLYLSAHRDLEAARLLAALGRDREAGQVFERVIEQSAAEAEVASAHLELGQLLARRLQHEPAVRHLQEAARRSDTRPAARRALVAELAALGLRDGARDVLLAARAEDPAVPSTLDDFLRAQAEASPPAATAADLVAGRYRLGSLLGYGATGRVYRANDEVTGREVAIKMVAGGYARGSPPYERFVREAGIASSLSHPNLVEVFDFSADFGYLVMEYMAGGSLDSRVERRLGPPSVQASPEPPISRPGRPRWGPGAVRRLALDVLAGLEAAHRRGVIHRDIKPANIFFDIRGSAKIGDFGVAHLLDLGQTQTGGLIGTLAYMSPEQITGAPLTVAADLYSTGVTLFECLTGRLPFLGPDFVAQHLGDLPPAPSAVAEGVAPAWDAILARLLAKDPEMRQGVDQLRREIAEIDPAGEGRAAALALPRSSALPASAAEMGRRSSSPADSGALPRTEDGSEARYRFETALGRSEISALSRAVDVTLDRSVIIERYDEGGLDPATERRLRDLAKSGGSFLQRVLAFDQTSRVVVYEAPAGMPLAERAGELDRLAAARLLKRLARAIAPLHELGAAHGAISATTVVIDELDNPTVLASGLGPAPPGASPAADVEALVAIVGRLTGGPTALDPLLATLTADLDPALESSLALRSPCGTGEALYSVAESVELALLKHRLQRSRALPKGDLHP
jgi:serine/threonine-protein kinase